MNFFTQPTFRANPKAVADDQHPDQQGRINGWPAGMAVVRSEMLVEFAQVEKPINPAEHVARRDVVLKVEGVEERRLSGVLTSHHRCGIRWIDGMSVDHLQMITSTEFFNGIGQKRSFVSGTRVQSVVLLEIGGTLGLSDALWARFARSAKKVVEHAAG